jgi:hypothetical protein
MRKLLLSFALALSLSALGASSALARPHQRAGKGAPEGAQKAPLFGPASFVGSCFTGGTPTPETFGFAVLNTPGDETTVTGEVALKRARPSTTYDVTIVQALPVGCEITIGHTITTNNKGNGNLHFTVERVPVGREFFVEVFNVANAEEYASPAVPLD